MVAWSALVTPRTTVSAILSLVLTIASRKSGACGRIARNHARYQSYIMATTCAAELLQRHQMVEECAPIMSSWSTATPSSAPPGATGLNGELGALAARRARTRTARKESVFESETRSDLWGMEWTAMELSQAKQRAMHSVALSIARGKNGKTGALAPRVVTSAAKRGTV